MGNWCTAPQFNKLYDKLHLVPKEEMGIRLLSRCLSNQDKEELQVSVSRGRISVHDVGDIQAEKM